MDKEEKPFATPYKRRFSRAAVAVKIKYRGAKSAFIEGYAAKSLSAGGTLIASEVVFPVGVFLIVELSLPDGLPPARIEGEVIYHRSGRAEESVIGMGVRWTKISDKNAQRIAAFVRSAPAT